MRRRAFLSVMTGALLAAPLPAEARQAGLLGEVSGE
jgi:hypothetical protein